MKKRRWKSPAPKLGAAYQHRKSGEWFITAFWIGKRSVALKHLNQILKYKDKGKVVSIKRLAHDYKPHCD